MQHVAYQQRHAFLKVKKSPFPGLVNTPGMQITADRAMLLISKLTFNKIPAATANSELTQT